MKCPENLRKLLPPFEEVLYLATSGFNYYVITKDSTSTGWAGVRVYFWITTSNTLEKVFQERS